ncbi:hypothetical protein C8Q70DRAFT_1050313 [Cubamyces menziesii]|uniref:Uncharacterized protein n=1 Tax=Trametes cubensis TaxID=1111947 RepID=A0AAD7X633_9APHY|nr:hypothetical protein C8Q70DRAFT_1050313 [Cubamyces menziesii]KAJ8462137.1 hypothetical protein ONZ51_g11092 [Trametes cubensis]
MSDLSRQHDRVEFHCPDPADGIVDIPGLGVFYHSTPPELGNPFDSEPMDDHYDQAGSIHYIPPNAVSTRYYALSNPNEYVASQPAAVVSSAVVAPVAALRGQDQAATHRVNDTMVAAALIAQSSKTADASPNLFTTYGANARLNPVLPKQRRNRDHPSGGSGRLAQTTASYEGHSAGASYTSILPQQWRMDYRGPDQPVQGATPENTPSATIVVPRVSVKIRDPTQHEQTAGSSTGTVPMPSPSVEMNHSAVYSPTTGRKIPLGVAGSSKGHAKMTSALPGPSSSPITAPAGTTIAKKPYKRGTPVACTFCRKRKVACGGPVGADEEGRCG